MLGGENHTDSFVFIAAMYRRSNLIYDLNLLYSQFIQISVGYFKCLTFHEGAYATLYMS